MDYNESIKNIVIPYLVSFYESLSPDLKVNYEIIDPESSDPSFYLSNSMSCEYVVRISYEYDGIQGTILNTVPKILRGIYIIKGRMRSPVMHLTNSSLCRIYQNRVQFRDFLNYNFDEKELVESFFNDEGELEFIRIPYEEINESKVQYELTDEQVKRFSIKLDWDDVPNKITRELIDKCEVSESDFHKDYLMDKEILTIEKNLLRSLRSSRAEVMRSMRTKFRRYGKLYSKDLQKVIRSFFNLQSDDEVSVQVPTNTNPLVIEAVSKKIVIPENVSYSANMADLIDPISTPQNNNINKLNEINVCVKVNFDSVEIEAYTTGFNKVFKDYLDYLNTPVILNSNVDYEGKGLIPNENGKLRVKYRNKIKEIDITEVTTDYLIEVEPDRKLSISSRRIPFINYSDSVRVGMGASMMKQAVELSNPEPPLVTTGTDEEDILNSSLITTHKGKQGKLLSIKGSELIVESEEGSKYYYTIPNPIQGMNDLMITFSVNKKVGDSIKTDEVIISPRVLKRKSFNFGVNGLAAFMPWRGYNNEDAIVISKSYSEKLSHDSFKDLEIAIKPNDLFIKSTSIGSSLKSKDVIFESMRDLNIDSIRNFKTDFQFSELSDKQKNNLYVPNNIENSIVTDILIIKGDLEPTEALRSKVSSIVTDKSIIKDKIANRLYYRNLDDSTEINLSEVSYVIKYRLLIKNKAKRGDKLTTRWGSKGVISLVLDDDQMPRTIDGKVIDIVLDPSSIFARKNPSHLLEMKLADLSKLMKDSFYKDYEGMTEDIFQRWVRFSKAYYKDKFTGISLDEMKDKLREYGDSVFSYVSGAFSKVSLEEVSELEKHYEVTNLNYLIDGKTGRKIKNPIVIGQMYFIKLYHLPEYKGKATPSIRLTDNPVAGKGIFRDSGQKLGEMEFTAMLSNNVASVLSALRGTEEDDRHEFLNELLLTSIILKKDGKSILADPEYSSKIDDLKSKYKS